MQKCCWQARGCFTTRFSAAGKPYDTPQKRVARVGHETVACYATQSHAMHCSACAVRSGAMQRKPMHCNAMLLCCAVQCCVVCCAMVCCAVLCGAVVCRVGPRSVLCCAALRHAMLLHAAPYLASSSALCSAVCSACCYAL